MAQSFGGKIRSLRKDKGLTLTNCGEDRVVGENYIWELENKNPTPSVSGKNRKDSCGARRH